MATITVDDAIEKLGGFGLFQWFIFAGVGLAEMAVTFQIFLLSFTAAEPEWVCRNESTICNFTKSFKVGDDHYDARCEMPRSEWTFKDDFTSIVTEFDLVCADSILATLASMIHFAGWTVGGLLFGYLADKLGRKIAFCSLVINVSLVAFAGSFVKSLWLFVLIRFFVGVGIGCKASLFVILSEFSGVKHRGLVGVMFWFPFIGAVMILPLFAYFIRDWRHLNILTSCLGFPSLLACWMCPESLRWSLLKRKFANVEKVLQKIAKYNRKPMIQEELKAPISSEASSSFLDLFSTSKIRKYLFLSCFIWFVESAVYYGVSFSSGNLGVNLYLGFFIINSMELPAVLIAMWTLNSPRFGRKWTTLIGMILATITSIAAVVFQMFQKEEKSSDAFWMMRILMNIFARLSITASFAGVWVWSNELFPTVVRNLGMGSTNGLARIGSFLSGYVIWLARIHVLIPYSIFSLLCFLASIACFLLPETKGQPTQEVVTKVDDDNLLMGNFMKDEHDVKDS